MSDTVSRRALFRLAGLTGTGLALTAASGVAAAQPPPTAPAAVINGCTFDAPLTLDAPGPVAIINCIFRGTSSSNFVTINN